MEITSKHIGQSVKTLVVAGAGSDFPANHERAADFAMEMAGETPARLADWDTDQPSGDDRITVRLYTA